MGGVQQFQQLNGPLSSQNNRQPRKNNDDDDNDDDNIVRQDRDRSCQHIRNCL